MQSMSAASRKYVVNPVPPVNGSSNPALLQRVMVMSAASAVSVPTSTGSGSRVYPTGAFASVMRYCTPVLRFSHWASPSAPVVTLPTSVHDCPSAEVSSRNSTPARASPAASTLRTEMLPTLLALKWIYAHTGSGRVVSAAHDWKSLPLLGSSSTASVPSTSRE